ncbi:hypothetical protein Sjap_015713 [Stephania japonica]|uniref:Transposase n=1 Tax=Stephania japonica TaxID=461633 RepID=A0AAP0IJM2_9MAGN
MKKDGQMIKSIVISSLKAVDLADWLAFRKKVESSTCIEKSNKYKELRSKNKLAHTMSGKGYARFEEEMRVRSGGADVTRADLWIEGHKNKKGRPHSDEIARVVGRVRGLGFGVTPTSVRATTQSSILVRKLQGDFQRLEEKHEQLAELVRSQQMPSSSRQQQNNPPNLRGKKCKIFDWLCTSKLVGEGEIETDDPMHLVDDIPIGGGAYLVYVERVFEHNAFLWRNQNNWTTLDNALGEIIPWPKEAVAVIFT